MATGISKTKWNGAKIQTNRVPVPKIDAKVLLSYTGKKPTKDILQTPPVKPHLLWSGSSTETSLNCLYFGDNLPILAHLLQDRTIKGKVKLVYIDPPFATRMIYQSRSSSDAYRDLLSGATYLEFLRERLILLREVLAEDGSIYVHLDENMAFPTKVLMDEIFGERNYRNWITRKKCNTKNYTRRTYGNVSDFILFYTKSDDYIWNRATEPWTPERAMEEYGNVESTTNRRYKKVPIHAPGVRNGKTGKPWRGMNPPPGKHWQFPPETLEAMDQRGEIYWSPNGNPRRKIYLDENVGVPVQDIWLDCRDTLNQNTKITGYPTEKNPNLLTRIISASSNPGDRILDAFCGSGTTLGVGSNLGRRWIGIDNSDEAIATCLTRFAEGTKPMGDFVGKRHRPMTTQKTPSHNIISDFALYAAEQQTPPLKSAVSKFKEQLALD